MDNNNIGISLRKQLIKIKKIYHTDMKNTIIKMLIVFIMSSIIGVMIDIFLPFNGLFNILRTVLLIPIAISGFVLFYIVSLKIHDDRVKNEPGWVSYRNKIPLMQRYQISAVASVTLLCVILVNGQTVGYTFLSAMFLILLLAIGAFIRKTKEENHRARFGILGKAEIEYRKQLEAHEDALTIAKKNKLERKELKKNRGKKEKK